MRLTDLLRAGGLPPSLVTPAGADPEIGGLTSDSRAVRPGDLFAALPGTRLDGSRFLADAAARGAVAALVGPDVEVEGAAGGLALLRDDNPRRRLALLAAGFFADQPRVLVAVTGTNGKSSVVHFARSIWQALGLEAASMGTLGLVSSRLTRPGGLTTPDPVALHRDLAELARAGVDHLALEASSHGLDQFRLDGLRLSAAAFTNLTRDHLDYHGTMARYFDAKARLFDTLLPAGAGAVINADIPQAGALEEIAARRGLRPLRYGRSGRELRLREAVATPHGQRLALEVLGARFDVDLPLVGGFQAENALAALGLVLHGGVAAERAVAALAGLRGAPGRLQFVGARDNGAAVYVDYAHTPDALETVLRALRPHARGKLAVVFGCGGDRDPGKRPVMGGIATRLADRVVVTDDNPRSEDPAAIRRAILEGCGGEPRVREIGDRRAAIAAAVDELAAGDVLVIAGKGHEPGQIVAGVVHPFDDAVEAQAALAAAGAAP